MNFLVKQLKIEDIGLIKDFYTQQIEALEKKELFYPYTDGEIEQILGGEGIMLGAFDGNKLVGLSCVDTDSEYSKTLLGYINKYYPNLSPNSWVYEYSGVVTHYDYRNKKIASLLYESFKDYVKSLSPAYLCAVVWLQNQASLNFFFRRGFRLLSALNTHNLDFGYLVLKSDYSILETQGKIKYINALSYKDYKRLLPKGFVGVGYENGKILMQMRKQDN